MREAWRLNKFPVYATVPPSSQLHVFFIFTGNELLDFKAVENAVVKSAEKLATLHKV
mgnify:CR=1 FL=1